MTNEILTKEEALRTIEADDNLQSLLLRPDLTLEDILIGMYQDELLLYGDTVFGNYEKGRRND